MKIEPEHILKKYWGYDVFRSGQSEIVSSILQGKDTLALLPTGGGKSICFQVPGMLFPGLSLVVSPLIALMKDQVDGLLKRDISAAYLNSGQSWTEQKIILENALQGHYKFLYVAPERLLSDSFREYLPNLNVSCLIIDEAHCISMWGSDFRPAFRKIHEVRELLPKNAPVAAFTASAPQWIQDDIIYGLNLRDPQVHQGAFGRPNLAFQSIEAGNKSALLLQALKQTKGCAIVFAPTRKAVQETAIWLQKEGISTHFYHGGLPNQERSVKQQEWIDDKVRVMVCTNAFGMGVDKPDVRYVFHLAPSASPEDYYQESGRAGRDSKKSYCVLLHEESDWVRAKEQIEMQHPTESQIKRVYHALMNAIGVSPGHGQHHTYPINYTESAKEYRIPVAEYFYALRALEKIGWIALNEGVRTQSRFMFKADFTEVYDFKIRHQNYEYLIDVLLRSYSGVFDGFNSFQELQIAKRLKKDPERIITMLNTLHKYKIIEYVPQTTDPLVTLIEPRVMYPEINMKELNELKIRRLQSLESLRKYAHNETCRSSFWIRYFTQNESEDCGTCDVCLRKFNARNIKELEAEITQKISQKNSDFHEFTHQFPLPQRKRYLEALERLIDAGVVRKTQTNLLILQS